MSNRHQNAHGGRNAERKVSGANSSSSTAHRTANGHSPSQDQRRKGEAHNSKSSTGHEPESMEDFDEIEFGQNSSRKQSSFYAPVEVEWFQSPPMMYNLKLKMKVQSNHEAARDLPLSERPQIFSSSLSTSMGSLDGIYRRVSVLPPIRISGSDSTRIRESSNVTKLDCCQFDGSSNILFVLTLPPTRKASKGAVRFLSLDLDSVQMLPWVTRIQPAPIMSPKDHLPLSASYASSSSSSLSTPSSHSLAQSLNYTKSDHYLKSIIGDDYVPNHKGLTWRDAGHVPTASELHGQQKSAGQFTDAQLLSQSVVSKQTVVFDSKGDLSRSSSHSNMSSTSSPDPPRRERRPKPLSPSDSIEAQSETETTHPEPSGDLDQASVVIESEPKEVIEHNETASHVVEESDEKNGEIPPKRTSIDSEAVSQIPHLSAAHSMGLSSTSLSTHLSLATPLDTYSPTSSGTLTPAPSTPTSSTSSSFSAMYRDPSEGVEYMARELHINSFGAEATTVAINRITSNWQQFDVLTGFSAGQILKWDPKVPKSAIDKEVGHPPKMKLFNENPKMIKGPVRKLAWFTHNQFLATYSDGFLYMFHMQCEDDPNFTREETDPRRFRMPKPPAANTAPTTSATEVNGKSGALSSSTANGTMNGSKGGHIAKGQGKSTILVDNVPIPANGWISEYMWLRVHRQSGKLYNPTGMWAISPGTAVTDFSLSADLKWLATVSKDGILRVFSMETYELEVAFKSYFGGFTSLAWSPDGAYLVTGGEDDLVSVWSMSGKTLVARGSAHSSWVSKIAFDVHRCSTGSYYRFASAGQDGQVALWEFSSDTLVPPKVNLHTQRARRLSSSKPSSIGSSSGIPNLQQQANESSRFPTLPLGVIPPVPKDQACQIEPIVLQRVTTSPCSELQFIGADLLMVGGWAGQCAFFLLESKDAPSFIPVDPTIPEVSDIFAKHAQDSLYAQQASSST